MPGTRLVQNSSLKRQGEADSSDGLLIGATQID